MLKQTQIEGIMPSNKMRFGKREVPKSPLSNPLLYQRPKTRPDVVGSQESFLILPDYWIRSL